MNYRTLYFICILAIASPLASCAVRETSEFPANVNRQESLSYSTNRALTDDQRKERENELDVVLKETYDRVNIKNFKPLRNSRLSVVDKLEIRISVFDLKSPRFFIFKNRRGQFSARYLPAIEQGVKDSRPTFVEVSPKSGFDTFSKKLETSRIAELRDEFALAEVDPVEDMGWIVVEINDENGYRHYAYSDYCDTPIPDGRNLIPFIKFIESEFTINLNNCNDDD